MGRGWKWRPADATIDQWECTHCHGVYPTQEKADACCGYRK